MGASLSGWAGRSSESMKWEIEKALAHRRSTDVEEELKDLKKAQEELVFENNQLAEQNNKYKQVTNELKESLQDVEKYLQYIKNSISRIVLWLKIKKIFQKLLLLGQMMKIYKTNLNWR